MSFFSELRRRNVIRVGIAYVVASWLLVQVMELAADAFGAPDWVLKLLITLLAVGLLPLLIFAWVYEFTPEGLRRESDIQPDESITAHTAKKLDLAVIVLLVAALGVFSAVHFGGIGRVDEPAAVAAQDENPDTVADEQPAAGGAPELSIAVLPFANMSPEPENEYFADGLSEELLNVLARIDGLKVAGRTSSFHFKGRNEDLRQIGETLGVANILEGSVRRQGDRVRITAQLIQASDGFHLWSETYDREMDDIFAIQDEISEAVASALRVTLLGDPAGSGSPNAAPGDRSIDPEVYSRFIAAKARIGTRDPQKVLEAVGILKEVTEQAPGFAPGYAALAVAALLAWNNDRTLTAEEALSLAAPAVDRAEQLAPDDDYVLAAKGLLLMYQGGLEQNPALREAATSALRRAIALNPENVDARYWLATDLMILEEDFGEAARLLDEALAIDPLARVARAQRINAYQQQGDFEAAARLAEQSVDLFPQTWFFYMWPAFGELQRGRPDRAIVWVERGRRAVPDSTRLASLAVWSRASLEDGPGLSSALDAQQALGGASAEEARIQRHIVDGDYDAALALIETAAERDGVGDWSYMLVSLAVQTGDCERAMSLEIIRSLLERWRGPDPAADPVDTLYLLPLSHCLRASGDGQTAKQLAEAALAEARPVSGQFDGADMRLNRVAALAATGDIQPALVELQEYYEDGFGAACRLGELVPLDTDVVFGPLHDQPEFQRIMAEIRARNTERLAVLRSGELTLDSPL
ncbi:MAG: tetratricopeptide repeat protein [Gammaproteobacteria bacterium]